MIYSIAEKYGDFIRDSGPFYHEFHADAFIKEPWNAYSSLFFLVPVIFWVWKLRGQYRENLIITLMLPLLFLNGIGSTLYHAFRAADFATLTEALDYAALGDTGVNFYTGLGEIYAGISYRELREQCLALAGKLLSLGVQKGDRVALVVNLKKIQRGKLEDPLLHKGDIVLVPESFF